MAIIKKYPAKIVSINSRIEGVFTLGILSLGKPFKYEPGQFLHLALDEYDPAEQWPDSRCFSMQSAPEDELIKITFAVKGKFTSRMQKELHIGTQVTLKMPYGDLFTQDHSKKNTIFIAGGTGITPFLSLFADPGFMSYSSPILYAGFRNSNLNLYQYELENARLLNAGFKIICVYQDQQGVLDIGKIIEKSDVNSSFFISGPPEMIKNFKNNLLTQGIQKNQILTDDWE